MLLSAAHQTKVNQVRSTCQPGPQTRGIIRARSARYQPGWAPAAWRDLSRERLWPPGCAPAHVPPYPGIRRSALGCHQLYPGFPYRTAQYSTQTVTNAFWLLPRRQAQHWIMPTRFCGASLPGQSEHRAWTAPVAFILTRTSG
jgi:hypothetical protein